MGHLTGTEDPGTSLHFSATSDLVAKAMVCDCVICVLPGFPAQGWAVAEMQATAAHRATQHRAGALTARGGILSTHTWSCHGAWQRASQKLSMSFHDSVGWWEGLAVRWRWFKESKEADGLLWQKLILDI